MGTVYRKRTTRVLPGDAEIITRKGERIARWKDGRGKSRSAPVTSGRDGSDRIVTTAATWTAKYRDGQGVVREVATGCREKQAALSVLAELDRRAELVKANVLTSAEDAIADHQHYSLPEHFESYTAHLGAKGISPARIANMKSQFKRVCTDCAFQRLSDLHAEPLTKWLLEQQREGMSAATRNGYRETLVMFANWCCNGSQPRLLDPPFANVPKADVKADRRRQRRAMTEAELTDLLSVARRRPILDAMTIRRGARKGQVSAKLRPETRARLVALGYERALIYKTLVLTGLRKSELASLTMGQCHLDGSTSFLELAAGDEKNREGSLLPLRADLATELREWIELKTTSPKSTQDAGSDAATIPFTPEVTQAAERDTGDSRRRQQRTGQEWTALPLFNVPAGLVRILNRDLKAAGIPKVDDRGRSLDVHALRHTFGTLLSKGGVAPRTAQAAMRHSHIDLTMNVYTDPRLLDVEGALEVLPALPLDAGQAPYQQPAQATGTDDRNALCLVAPMVAPNLVQPCISESIPVTTRELSSDDDRSSRCDVTAGVVTKKDPLSHADNGSSQIGVTGFEPATSTSRT